MQPSWSVLPCIFEKSAKRERYHSTRLGFLLARRALCCFLDWSSCLAHLPTSQRQLAVWLSAPPGLLPTPAGLRLGDWLRALPAAAATWVAVLLAAAAPSQRALLGGALSASR